MVNFDSLEDIPFLQEPLALEEKVYQQSSH